MPPTINTEWLNENSQRAYPFRENSLMVPSDEDGNLLSDFRLPNYVIADLVLTVPGDDPVRAYASQVSLIGNLLSAVIKDSDDVQITTLTVDLSTHSAFDAYNLVGSGDLYGDVRGKLVIGDLATLNDDLAEGLYSFGLSEAEFEPSTLRPSLRGVRSLQLSNGGAETDLIFGHVKLLAGSNIRLTYIEEFNTVRIDAVEGAGLAEECDCAEEVGSQNLVQTINGIPIEDAQIVGDGSCVEVTVNGSIITISDACSTPCCGCPELEFVTESLKVLESTVGNLEQYSAALSERISTFVTNFVLTIGAAS